MQRFPSAVLEASRETTSLTNGTSTPTELDVTTLTKQLTTLGFRPTHIRSCVSALHAAHIRLHSPSSSSAKADPLVLSLSILSPLEAGIEWLLLHLPEDDLPPRYRPSSSSSEFITGARVGGADVLVKGWLVERLVKDAGFPRKAVQRVLDDTERGESAALDILGRRLCGWENSEEGWGISEYGNGWRGDASTTEERNRGREEEIMALDAVLGDRYRKVSPTELVIDIPSSGEKVKLHVIFDQESPYPSPQHPNYPPSFYLSSPTLPAYMRLALHASMLRQFRDPERHDLRSVLEYGAGGAILIMVEYLETTLPEVIENPPDIAEVTKHLVQPVVDERVDVSQKVMRGSKKREGGLRKRVVTEEDEHNVKRRWEDMKTRKGYEDMVAERSRLPAWKEKDRINSVLASNRVLVVVGEVSRHGNAANAFRLVVERGKSIVCNYYHTDSSTVHSSRNSYWTTR
jgi:ATP-dependent RNA helicase DHX57